jgi:hypothetical protein
VLAVLLLTAPLMTSLKMIVDCGEDESTHLLLTSLMMIMGCGQDNSRHLCFGAVSW